MTVVSHFAILIIRIYQLFISPFIHFLFPSTGCRFHPTCSQVTIQGIMEFGLIRGIKLGLAQFSRCHPFSK